LHFSSSSLSATYKEALKTYIYDSHDSSPALSIIPENSVDFFSDANFNDFISIKNKQIPAT